jgi:hypothetical protein
MRQKKNGALAKKIAGTPLWEGTNSLWKTGLFPGVYAQRVVSDQEQQESLSGDTNRQRKEQHF